MSSKPNKSKPNKTKTISKRESRWIKCIYLFVLLPPNWKLKTNYVMQSMNMKIHDAYQRFNDRMWYQIHHFPIPLSIDWNLFIVTECKTFYLPHSKYAVRQTKILCVVTECSTEYKQKYERRQ